MTGVGTPLFCASEIVNAELYSEAVDVYSFGLTLINLALIEDITVLIAER